MTILQTIQTTIGLAVKELYGEAVDIAKVQVTATPADHSGDYTAVIFPFLKISQKPPDVTGGEIGEFVVRHVPEVQSFAVVKGFLNLELSAQYWNTFLEQKALAPRFGYQPKNGKKVLVEYSSPNTNKPLHLGHIRNILLGWSCSKILSAVGYEVARVQIINDRGVAICKSMLAWEKFGNGATPESTDIKGDHFVGDFYVLFENKMKAEYEAWQASETGVQVLAEKKKPEQSAAQFYKDFKNAWFNQYSVLGAEIREMLLKWENNDPEVRALWTRMNSWVYSGFEKTYTDLGVAFDKLYYESDTYLLGKSIVEEGLDKGIFFRKPDSSVWIDLTDAGHDQKVLLRADGTSVYITQDMGTARMRYEDFACESMLYVVADEQNYHFQVLFETLKRLGEPYAQGLHHLSYGLVELPSGRMKTREGTVVDADDLMAEVVRIAREQAAERGELDSITPAEQTQILQAVGMGALKFFIIKVHPKRKMIFNPEESVELQGQTGPYVQYSYVRMNGLMQRVVKEGISLEGWTNYTDFKPQEKELLKLLHEYPAVVLAAAEAYDPSLIANHCYALAKAYHRFWHDLKVMQAETEEARGFRLQLSKAVGQTLQLGMDLLGIQMPERM